MEWERASGRERLLDLATGLFCLAWIGSCRLILHLYVLPRLWAGECQWRRLQRCSFGRRTRRMRDASCFLQGGSEASVSACSACCFSRLGGLGAVLSWTCAGL